LKVNFSIGSQVVEILPEKLLGSFPDGAQTTCKSSDVVLTAVMLVNSLNLIISLFNQLKKWQML